MGIEFVGVPIRADGDAFCYGGRGVMMSLKGAQIALLACGLAWPAGGQTPPGQAIEVISRTERAEVEVVTISPHGFQPARIVRPAGPFILVIENRTALKEKLDLDLETAAKQKIKGLEIFERNLEVGEAVRLPAGKYTLTVKGREKYTLSLEIKP